MRDIPGYKGLYAVTISGEIYSLVTAQGRRKRVLKPYEIKNGYLKVGLFKNGKRRPAFIHRLVALTYLPNPLVLCKS